MGDLHIDGEIIESTSTACYDVVKSTSLFYYLGFWSSVVEDLVLQDIYRYSDNLVVISSGQHPRSSSQSICKSTMEECSSLSNSYIVDTFCGRRALDVRKGLFVNTRFIVTEAFDRFQGMPFIFQWLMLSLFGLQLVWRLTLDCWRCSFYYIKCAQVQVHSITSWVCKTLCGSSGDIGWLQNTPGLHPVEDGTTRFLEILDSIRDSKLCIMLCFWAWRAHATKLICFSTDSSNHGPLYFVATKRFFSKKGLACHITKIHSEYSDMSSSFSYIKASVEHNALELKQYIEELFWGSGKRVMLLGHSKGGVDVAAALSIYWCDLKNKVAGLALVQSPYGGTPVTSDILHEGQIADKETQRIMELIICKIIKGDMRALEDLTYEKQEFIMNHKLPDEIPLISFHSEANIAPGVLATVTHIAHVELPWLPLPNFGNKESDTLVQEGRQLPVVIPISAAMALCALHLWLRYGEKSDGLVTCHDAEVPGSVVVRPNCKLDHAWMVYSSWKKNPSEPDACEMCEALLTMLVELGKMKQE